MLDNLSIVAIRTYKPAVAVHEVFKNLIASPCSKCSFPLPVHTFSHGLNLTLRSLIAVVA